MTEGKAVEGRRADEEENGEENEEDNQEDNEEKNEDKKGEKTGEKKEGKVSENIYKIFASSNISIVGRSVTNLGV